MIKPEELSPDALTLLGAHADGRAVSVAQLAARFGWDEDRVERALVELERRGFIERSQ
jgi:predicted transcriptional regulator